jgi:hypothetical protein
VLGGAVAAPAFAAEPPYEFDALRSLTGGCTTSVIDPVPDPGCPGPQHPPKSFSKPTSIAVDSKGVEYVASYGATGSPEGSEGRIDVFAPDGKFITEVSDPFGPKSVAVDGEGNLYAFDIVPGGEAEIARHSPSKYEPETGKIEYGNPRAVLSSGPTSVSQGGVAVDASNDHLFVTAGNSILEYGSADEGNPLLGTITDSRLISTVWVAVDAERRRLYASSCPNGNIEECWVLVFDADAPHDLLEEVDGSNTPAGEFVSNKGWTSIAVDEETGHFFVDDLELSKNVYEFDQDYEYVSTLKFGFESVSPEQIAISNVAGSANHHYLYVPSHPGGVGHAFAFHPPAETAPEVESLAVANIAETEAELRARIDPHGGDTHYVFEYTTQGSFEEEGFASAQIAGEGTIPPTDQEAQVSAPATALSPAGSYRFRVLVENGAGSDEGQAGFTTYSDASGTSACPNQGLRGGYSALLPDCRAYELVSPPDTNGRPLKGVGFGGDRFTTLEASPAGSAVSFVTEGGSLPGTEGAGALNGDLYRSERGASGWTTLSAGPSGAESTSPSPGSTSPDQGYAFWTASREGSAVIGGESTQYVHYPDGHSALVGRGSLGIDPRAAGRLITANGGHVIFETRAVNANQPVQLEPNAPPSGTRAVYDRTADEVTHVVSLLPGDLSPVGGQGARYVGASTDGAGVAFSIDETLYLRLDNAETFEIGENVDFAGVSDGGERVFYVEGGDLIAFDTASENTVDFTDVGNATVVNVAAGGTRAYFTSITAIPGSGENPNGALAKAGQPNLYLSEEGQIRFVATVTARDVEGEHRADGQVDGLGLWTDGLVLGELSKDPSRLTPDGSVLLFQSRANLAGYDSGAFAQVYRYDSGANRLHCLSCIPTNEPARGGASLESPAPDQDNPEPFSAFGFTPNLRSDGGRAFFQSTEALVSFDNDDVQDVYEWEEQGAGSCTRAGGCVYLVSSGHSSRDNYLYGISASGDDVFFVTTDVLSAFDAGDTASIYDARVGGGFAEESEGTCAGEGCRPLLMPPPSLPQPANPELGARDNLPKSCPRGKRKVKRQGKVRCVKKHRQQKHRKAKSGTKKGVGK